MSLVLRNDLGAIARLTLNAPGNLNALSLAMLDSLSDALATLAADPAIRIVILEGAGRAFCAGHDLREMLALRDGPEGGLGDLFSRCSAVMAQIAALPQPVIAQVHGIATAAGCQLVAACDMAVAAEGTRFGVNGVNIGLFCATPMVALTRAIAPRVAFEMLATGRFVETGEALSLGLITRAAPANELAEVTEALATTLAAKLPAALQLGKRAFRAQAALSVDQAYAAMSAVMVANMALEDTAEGIAAFLDKRSPNWPAA